MKIAAKIAGFVIGAALFCTFAFAYVSEFQISGAVSTNGDAHGATGTVDTVSDGGTISRMVFVMPAGLSNTAIILNDYQGFMIWKTNSIVNSSTTTAFSAVASNQAVLHGGFTVQWSNVIIWAAFTNTPAATNLTIHFLDIR